MPCQSRPTPFIVTVEAEVNVGKQILLITLPQPESRRKDIHIPNYESNLDLFEIVN